MPLPFLLAAAPALAQAGGGLFQTLFSGRGKAIKNLENMANQSPIYRGSKPISDYYNEAKSRYQVSPYQSTQYLVDKQNAERTTANMLNSLQSRGGALGSAGKIVGLQNDALLKAANNAENERSRRFGQYGTATGMKAGDDMRKFQINELDPYNRKFSLASMKAGQASAQRDAGLSNLYGGLSNASLLMSGLKKSTLPYKQDNFEYLQSIGD